MLGIVERQPRHWIVNEVALALIVEADTTMPLTLYNLATWSAYFKKIIVK